MRKMMLFVLAVLALVALSPQDAQAGRRRGGTIRSATERTNSIADSAVDSYCSRYDCSTMYDRGSYGYGRRGYDYSYRYGRSYDYRYGRRDQSGRFFRQAGRRILDEIQDTRERNSANETMLLARCSDGSQEACELLAGINPRKYGHMRQTAPQPVSSRREYEDDQPEAEQTAPRTARRLNIRITNFSRFDALVFNEDSREVAQVPGKRWSGVSEFGDGYWAALNVEGVWCEADIKRNGDNFQILSRTTCTKVEIE